MLDALNVSSRNISTIFPLSIWWWGKSLNVSELPFSYLQSSDDKSSWTGLVVLVFKRNKVRGSMLKTWKSNSDGNLSFSRKKQGGVVRKVGDTVEESGVTQNQKQRWMLPSWGAVRTISSSWSPSPPCGNDGNRCDLLSRIRLAQIAGRHSKLDVTGWGSIE